MAILMFHRSQQHHTNVVEPHFPFLHLHKNYNLFKTIYQSINKLNQNLSHTTSNKPKIFTIAQASH